MLWLLARVAKVAWNAMAINEGGKGGMECYGYWLGCQNWHGMLWLLARVAKLAWLGWEKWHGMFYPGWQNGMGCFVQGGRSVKAVLSWGVSSSSNLACK